MPLETGELLADRYRIVRMLGHGGMGAVYLATDESLGQPCAVKENLNFSADSERLFRREATLLAGLRHRHLPRVTHHFVIGSQHYLVMDYVEGEDLKQRLERSGPLPEHQVLSWVEQLCDALAYLHSLKPPIVHRDIKPANIKLTPAGEIMLVDFGLARQTNPGEPQVTTNTLSFTPGFTPPEQYGLGRTDTRTDQYALAATVFTLLTGHPPPDSVERLMGTVVLIPPDKLQPGLSASLSEALVRAMALQPEDRFASVSSFRIALKGALPVAASPTAGTKPFFVSPPTLLEQPGLPSAEATLLNVPAVAPPQPQVPDGPTMPVVILPPASAIAPVAAPLVEQSSAPATLYEPISAAATSPMPLPPAPALSAAAPDRPGPPSAAPAAALPTPPRPAARPRPRWLLPVLGCAALLLAAGGLAGGTAFGLYLNRPTPTELGQALTPPAGVTLTEPGQAGTAPVVVEVNATAGGPAATPTELGQAGTAPLPTSTEPLPAGDTATATTPVPTEVSPPPGTPIGGGSGRLAFISKRGGQFFQVYTMNVDGSDVRQVTTDPTDKWSPKWAYNGTQLAWSPDGTQLIYVADAGGGNRLDLWLIDADGANPRDLTNARDDDFQPSWCGNGTIWFASNRINGVQQIFGTSLDSIAQGLQPFNFSATHASPREFDPAPYPGCERLMFTSLRGDDAAIWRYFPDCAECYRKVRSFKEYDGRAQEPALSPDGAWLVFSRVLPDSIELVLAGAEDLTVDFQLTDSQRNYSAQWSPDGEWLTFVSERDGNREIYIMNRDGEQQTNVSQNPTHDTDPVWQPAGP